MRISDWSSDVCSSDLPRPLRGGGRCGDPCPARLWRRSQPPRARHDDDAGGGRGRAGGEDAPARRAIVGVSRGGGDPGAVGRTGQRRAGTGAGGRAGDRKSGVQGKSVSVPVDHGGRLNIKKKKSNKNQSQDIDISNKEIPTT